MYFLGVGVVLLFLKWQEIGPVASWSWWLVLAPFALAVLWWQWADASGYSKRRAMDRDAARRTARIAAQREALKPNASRKR